MRLIKSLRPHKPLIWLLLLAALLSLGAYLRLSKDEVNNKIIMYYGGWDVKETFDATKWFSNGMYRSRNIEADGGPSNVTMLRNKPLKLSPKQVEQLPIVVAGAFFSSSENDLDLEAFATSQPELSNRYRYAYSAFAKPNTPEDYYYLYLDWQNRQFVVTFSMDAQRQDTLSSKYVQEVYSDQPSSAEHLKVFAEITEAERRAHD